MIFFKNRIMKQEKIRYRDVMDLGFTEVEDEDKVYFDQYGFDDCIITKDLTKKIYLDWDKATQLCMMDRNDSQK